MKRKYLLDTNHLSAAMAPVSRVRDRIIQTHRAGHKFGAPLPVICELEAGIRLLGDLPAARRQLQWIFTKVSIWPMDLTHCQTYGEIFHRLREAGRVLSQVDMMIAAMAQDMNLIVLTSDRDFEALLDIRTENWTA